VVEILEVLLDVLHNERQSPVTVDHMQYMTDQLLHHILLLTYRTDPDEPIAVSTLYGKLDRYFRT